MRILHVVSNISIRSGIMSVLMSYYRNVDRKFIEFDFLYYDERPITFEKEIEELGGKVYKIIKPSHVFKFSKELKEFLEIHNGKYNIIHIHDIFMSGFFLKAKKYGNIDKIIVHSHATKFSEKKIKAIRNKILTIPNYFIPDYYFACSSMAGKKIFGTKFDKNGIIVKNAIDLNKFYPDFEYRNYLRQKMGIEDNYVVGHVGNFVLQKNHFFLLKIFKRISEANEKAILILVGDGKLRERLLIESEKMRIRDKIIFLGTRDDVNKIMQTFDCFLFPSIFEGLGIVLVEAQATGIPCVYSDIVPKEANILEETNQIISLNENVSKWANAVLNCSKVNIEILKKSLEEKGYDIRIEAKKLQEIYYKVLN